MKHALLLYSTSHCHLCEQALAIINDVRIVNSFTVRLIDIAEDDLLMERYGLRIPVLACADGSAELNWPFDHGHVQELLKDL